MKKARYIRQSTKNQTNLRQLAKAHPDEELFIDIISGSIPFDERPEGKRLIQAVETGQINYVSFHAIDRAGRNTINVLQTLQYFYDKGVVVKIDNLGLESMINNKANPVFNLITTILSELSSLEKTSLLERQSEGIQQAKLKGVYKGRAEGTFDTPEQTLQKHKRVVRAIKMNPTLSLRQIAKLASDSDYKVSANTVNKVKRINVELKFTSCLMMRVDLTAIHNLMFKFYGSREMQMDTIVESKHFLRPKEIIIKFDFKKDCNLDIEKLTRRLARYIWNVHNFFVTVKDDTIEICIIFYIKRKLKDFDFEFSEN